MSGENVVESNIRGGWSEMRCGRGVELSIKGKWLTFWLALMDQNQISGWLNFWLTFIFYKGPAIGFRFFTVYGPAGRPDVFYFYSTKALAGGGTIKIFNYGDMRRDFTYIDDIVEGVYRVMHGAPQKAKGENGLPVTPYAVYNIGGGQPENQLDYTSTLQEELVRAGVLSSDYDFEGHRQLVGMQPGDVPVTYADAAALEEDCGFTPKIWIREGLRKFAE